MIPDPAVFITFLSQEESVKIILSGEKDKWVGHNKAWLEKIIDEFENVNSTPQFFSELQNSTNPDVQKMWKDYMGLRDKLSGKEAKKNLRSKIFTNFNRVVEFVLKISGPSRSQYKMSLIESKETTTKEPSKQNLTALFNKLVKYLKDNKFYSPNLKYPYGQELKRLFSNKSRSKFSYEDRTKLYSAFVKEFTSDSSLDNFLNIQNPTFGHVLFSFYLSEESGINNVAGFTKGRGKLPMKDSLSPKELEVWRKVEPSTVKSLSLPKELTKVVNNKDISVRTVRTPSLLDHLLLRRDEKAEELDETSAEEVESTEFVAKTGVDSGDLSNFFNILQYSLETKSRLKRIAPVRFVNSVNMSKIVNFGTNKSIRVPSFVKSLLTNPPTERLFENSAKNLLSSGSFSIEQFENYFKTKNPNYDEFNDSDRDAMLREFKTLSQKSTQSLELQQNLILPKQYLPDDLDEDEKQIIDSMDKIGDSYLATTSEQKALYADLKNDFDNEQLSNSFSLKYTSEDVTEVSIVNLIELARKETVSLKQKLNISNLSGFEAKAPSMAEAIIISLFIIKKVLGVNIDKEVEKIDSLLPDPAQPLSGGTQSLEQAVNALAKVVETNLKQFQIDYIKAFQEHLSKIVQDTTTYSGLLTGKTLVQLKKKGLITVNGGENDG